MVNLILLNLINYDF